MEKKLQHFLKTQNLELKDKTVLVGVSGGPDSVALLYALHQLAKENSITLIGITVDHQLRGQAAKEDVNYVCALCDRLRIPIHIERIDVTSYKQASKQSTQLASRILRYEAFEKWMTYYEADYLMLGHHGDDQIETMTMRLIQSATSQSFQGIPAKRPFAQGSIIRPLIYVTKKQIYDYCEAHQLQAREDASNDDHKYMRNDIRQHIIPKMKEYNDNLHKTVNYLQESLQEDQALIMDLAKKQYDKVIQYDSVKKHYLVDLPQLLDQHLAVQRRLFALLMKDVYQEEQVEIRYIHEQQFSQLSSNEVGNKRIYFPNGVTVERAYDKIYLYREKRKDVTEYVIDKLGQSVQLSEGEVLTIEETDDLTENNNRYVFPKSKLTLPLVVRKRKNGDRMTYRGLDGSKKLKDIFIDEKVPRHERDNKWLIEDGSGQIIWLINMKRSFFTRGEEAEHVRITYKKENHL